MTSRFQICTLAAITLLWSAGIAAAQGTAGTLTTPNSGIQGGVGSPTSPVTTGVSPGVTSQPGAPSTSAPGRIGTGTSPSGLAGDNPAAPGFPGRVGR
jgi:hypothetical protein